MTVSIVSLSARGEGEVAVTFELCEGERAQKETFLISAAMMADWRLTRGESNRDCYDAVSREAQIHRVTKRGLYLLGYGACSKRALCRKLVAKGEGRDVAQEAVERICRDGYLNEFADAEREAERCVSKEWGERRIVDALQTKGFSREAIRSALEHLEDMGVDYVELCAEQIRKRCDELPESPADRQKLFAAMTRYGFSASEIREAITLLREQ